LQAESIGLSPLGKKQVADLAKALCSKKIDSIITSPMQRARETATIIKSICNVSMAEDPRLSEHIVSRDKTDRQEVKELRQKVRMDYDFVPPDGESFSQSVSRFNTALREIASAHGGKVIVVTHREILQNFLLDEFSLSSAPPISEPSPFFQPKRF
jgi:broad specificity phosphatase PhoE